MHETAHVVEFLIRLEKQESVKISCGIDRHSLALSEGYTFAPWLSAIIIIHHPLHGQRWYTKRQSVRCLVESRTRVEGA
jgi:hypothetical protein